MDRAGLDPLIAAEPPKKGIFQKLWENSWEIFVLFSILGLVGFVILLIVKNQKKKNKESENEEEEQGAESYYI